MNQNPTEPAVNKLAYLGINPKAINYQLNSETLLKIAKERNEGHFSESGAFNVKTGNFTGRSPKDRFIVLDEVSENEVNWGEVNIPLSQIKFVRIYTKVRKYLADKEVFVRDAYLGADQNFNLNVRVITNTANQNLFAGNLFRTPENFSLEDKPEWTLIAVPDFKADPKADGTRQENFTIISFEEKIVLIGGSAYSGEIKKAMFSVLNFLLPFKNVLPMHCSATIVDAEIPETTLFFGLSGTGKTTLSADPELKLIGDDEHGWSTDGIFNFEGGCYAKTAGLNPSKEPSIYSAIKTGCILENVFHDGEKPNYDNCSITENGRAAYPLSHIVNACKDSKGPSPKHIIFLSADAFGVLPPVARLSYEQAMYYFLSGYTAKVAGTELGVNEPTATFSACFGSAFMPLHPVRYANLLGEKIKANDTKVWLVNTGWIGGAYGVGERISLHYTRNIVKAIQSNLLENTNYRQHPIFRFMIPETCKGVPSDMLYPANNWKNKEAYMISAYELAGRFEQNFKKFENEASNEIKEASPVPGISVAI